MILQEAFFGSSIAWALILVLQRHVAQSITRRSGRLILNRRHAGRLFFISNDRCTQIVALRILHAGMVRSPHLAQATAHPLRKVVLSYTVGVFVIVGACDYLRSAIGGTGDIPQTLLLLYRMLDGFAVEASMAVDARQLKLLIVADVRRFVSLHAMLLVQ